MCALGERALALDPEQIARRVDNLRGWCAGLVLGLGGFALGFWGIGRGGWGRAEGYLWGRVVVVDPELRLQHLGNSVDARIPRLMAAAAAAAASASGSRAAFTGTVVKGGHDRLAQSICL